jgi:tetratricopeptide (TPR) repeat protein
MNYARRQYLPVVLLVVGTLLLGSGCAKKVAPPRTGPAGRSEDQRVIEHTVGTGETLARIADNYYGDPARFEDIARDNGITDPSKIVPGSVLRMQFSEDEYAAARKRSAALAPYNKGVDLMANERLGEAEKQFRLALGEAPDLTAAKYNLALVLLKRGRTEQALTLLEDLTALRPKDTDFRFAHGNALFQAARFDEAAVQFQAALAVNPVLKRAAFGYARSLQEAGDVAGAISAWERYLDLDGTSSWAAAAQRNLKTLRDDDGS